MRKKNRVCPVAMAGSLDSRMRRWIQNPRNILEPFIKEGMTVLDIGCGPGFFTLELAEMVGQTGHVIAADLQEGMLWKLRDKIKGSDIESRITLHKCEEKKIGVLAPVDFVLCFYLVHELPNQDEFFKEIKGILKPAGQVLIAEPPIHVSKKAFAETINKAGVAGFIPVASPKVFFSKTVLLKNS